MDSALIDNDINDLDFNIYMNALLNAMSQTTTAPGHFAQYLKVKDLKTFSNIKKSRMKCVWTQFLQELNRIQPYGTPEWREKNKVFCKDANTLLNELSLQRNLPSVVYADPPYSQDMYSRYYTYYGYTVELEDIRYSISEGAVVFIDEKNRGNTQQYNTSGQLYRETNIRSIFEINVLCF